MRGNLLTIFCVAFCIEIYKKKTSVIKVETDIIASNIAVSLIGRVGILVIMSVEISSKRTLLF